MVRPTIFIQIAAYRDPDLPATLHNLLAMATDPARLHIGICLQLAENDPADWDAAAFPDHPHLSRLCTSNPQLSPFTPLPYPSTPTHLATTS